MSSDFLTKDIVYISSADRTSGTTSDFTIDISGYVRTPNDYDYATLLNFSCPKSYYLINDRNNTFTLTEDKTVSTITIPNGNYDVTSMKTQLVASLSGHSYTYAITYSRSLNKYTFTVSGNSTQPIFDFSNSELYLIIGFEPQQYQFVVNTLSSENTCFMQLTNSILLCCDFVRGNILSSIVPNVSDFSYITYEENNPSFASHDLIRNDLLSARFYLLSAITREPIDLNGIDYTFSFAIYQRNKYFHTMIDDKKIQLQIEELQAQHDALVNK